MYQKFGESTLRLLLLALSITKTSSSQLPSIFNNNNYQPNEVIERDVCIIGGGATGSYAAVRLQDMGHSIFVVERQDRLGGHTETYTDPKTGKSENLGVVVYQPEALVKHFFGRFNLTLTRLSFDGRTSTRQFDFRSGRSIPTFIDPNAHDVASALSRYAEQVAKYPYLASGFDLEYPVPSDLLISFGSFIEKYNLSAAVRTLFNYAQGLGDFLDLPTIYVMKNFGLVDYNDVTNNSYLTSANGDNGQLYEKVYKRLNRENVSLQSTVVATARPRTEAETSTPHPARILISTPTGLKLILAKRILFTIPPLLSHLEGWDLDDEEHTVLSQFTSRGYYTGLLRDTGLSTASGLYQNAALNTSFNLPVFPGIYSLTPAPQIAKDAFGVKYGSPVALPEEAVKEDIIAAVKRLQGNHTIATPEFLAFKSHTPFELTVSPELIARGYYRQLYGLQGRNGMFYTGAAFHTHDSSLLWRFTEESILPKLNQSLHVQ